MALATSYTTIINLRIDLLINEPTTDANGNPAYQPLTIRSQGRAVTSDGGAKDVSNITLVGNSTASPLTPKQIYTQMGNLSTLNTTIQQALYQMYLSAINTDLTV